MRLLFFDSVVHIDKCQYSVFRQRISLSTPFRDQPAFFRKPPSPFRENVHSARTNTQNVLPSVQAFMGLGEEVEVEEEEEEEGEETEKVLNGFRKQSLAI